MLLRPIARAYCADLEDIWEWTNQWGKWQKVVEKAGRFEIGR
jgi:hypothetical protein